ncbi:hypothetical protein [Aurantiacibacter rhizosphaerae]|uniref:Uncharacterized protein n=1 Tax=Aurantiacibacter rhizosphaerae TaxID=2691582 RepID=A0A844XE61_9SPHN|nr:hypothetical protein [Aurantiacibacter rhizosphaerae]MWV28306.1 hypothetical protein [Aurantiacibacter rhizosphaerae]
MNKAILAAATALSMVAIPAAAQVNTVDDKRDMTEAQQMMYDELDTDQQAMFDAYTPDQQTMYFGWPTDLRGYYWSLEQDQQDAWWYLDDNQRTTLYQIQAPEQRQAAWTSVISQVNKLENGAATSSAQASTTSGDIRFVSKEMAQSIPAAHQGEYPVCKSDSDDNCINAWATGARGPGVDRPLDYWPGKPASSM